MSEKKIPNLNTHSTLCDRLSIERIKWNQFTVDNELEKVKMQEEIVSDIVNLIEENLREIIEEKSYEFYSEKRTFEL